MRFPTGSGRISSVGASKAGKPRFERWLELDHGAMNTASTSSVRQHLASGAHKFQTSSSQQVRGSKRESGLKPRLIGERQALKRKLERAEVMAFDGVLKGAFKAFFGFAFAIPGGSDQLFSSDGFWVGGALSRFQAQ
jgi:hypothetical protein